MANKEHLQTLKQGVNTWNDWRQENPHLTPDISKSYLAEMNLEGANLSGADLSFTNLSRANLRESDLRGANLQRVMLFEGDLSGADLTGANLQDSRLLRVNYAGTKFQKSTQLGNANLRDALMTDSDLSATVLCGSDLRRADLSNSNLEFANLSHADLSEARLWHANLRRAYLNDAKLKGARFLFSDLSEAHFHNTDFTEAEMGHVKFIGVDLRTAKALETVRHYYASIIDVSTLYYSRGKISKKFLAGCGLPDNLITYLPSLVGGREAIQFYSCFISYTHKDEDFAKRLYSRMREENLRVWFAPEHIRAGEKLYEQIDHAIQLHDRLLVIVSENSMRSEWVMTEIRRAMKTERNEGRRKLFPIRLVSFEAIRNWDYFDADIGKDLWTELREYFIPDFSDWKNHDVFETEFAKLLRDLKANQR